MLKIGNKRLKSPYLLAPMAGYTNSAFRRLMAQLGAALTPTEMISVSGLRYKNQKTASLLSTSDAEAIKCVQLFGVEPADFAAAAALDQLSGFDIIDINMGCPVKKVFSLGGGCALMGERQRAADIVCALKGLGKTVTVKTRLGIKDPQEIFDFAPIIEAAGADMLTVHCRTAQQMYCGTPDYRPIKKLKEMLSIPVVINGDIVDSQSLFNAQQSGADGFMIGRGALLNPLIFLQLSGVLPTDNSAQILSKRIEQIFVLIDYMSEDFGTQRGAVELRKFMPYLLKGIAKRAQRHTLNYVDDCADLKQRLQSIFDKNVQDAHKLARF